MRTILAALVALVAFVAAWLAADVAAHLLFGSGNALIWLIAGMASVAVMLFAALRQRRSRSVTNRPTRGS